MEVGPKNRNQNLQNLLATIASLSRKQPATRQANDLKYQD